MRPPLCITHASCLDGTCAAAAFKIKHPKGHIKYQQYGYDFNVDMCKDRDVYITDFCFPPPILKQIYDISKTLTILDHHVTAVEHMINFMKDIVDDGTWNMVCKPDNNIVEEINYGSPGNKLVIRYRLNESGAMVTYKHFNPDTYVPDFVQYISDRDLWKWALPDSKRFGSYLKLIPLDVDVFIEHINICLIGSEFYNECLLQGDAIRTYMDLQIGKAKYRMRMRVIGGIEMPTFGCTEFISETHQSFYEDSPNVSCSWFIKADTGEFSFSLRSLQGSNIDVSEIAKSYGGGGHENAAGFTLDGYQARDLIGIPHGNTMLGKGTAQ